MSKINVTNIVLSSNREQFIQDFRIEIFGQSMGRLMNNLEWKIIYVGSAESSNYDQVLEDIMMPIECEGPFSFEVTVNPADPALIPTIDDLLGPSALMISALYNNNEFFRVSYFVHNAYESPTKEFVSEENFDIKEVFRHVLTDKPRIKLNDIDWNDEQNLYLASKINLHNQEDILNMRKETENLFNDYKDPFGFNENSFLGKSYFNNN